MKPIYLLLSLLFLQTHLQAEEAEKAPEKTETPACEEEKKEASAEKSKEPESKEEKPCEKSEEKKKEDDKDSDDDKKKDDKDSDDEKKTDEKSSDDDKDDKKGEERPKEWDEPPPIGNFSLPTSQQPAALFGFGGNIIDKGEVQLYFFADDFEGKKKTTIDLIPSVLFGITDEWSIFFNFPFTPRFRDGKYHSSGLEDFFVQLEYAFYNKKGWNFNDQATVVLNVTVPTGSINKNPPTGFGAPSFFLGGTYYHVLIDWFVFTSHGAIVTFSDRGTKAGDQFLYQFGFGRYIPSPCGWIFAWMLEVDGQYFQKNRNRGVIDHDSGGNYIYATPSLWVSTKEMLFQFGVSAPVNQNLFGKQRRFDYALNLNWAWSFY